MYRNFIFILLIFFIGCDSDSDEPVPSQVLNFTINDKTVTFTDKDFSGNENCGYIFINTSALTDQYNSKFHLDIDLTTDGYIQDVLFVDYSDQNRYYRTADFNSSKVFFIKDFRFDPSDRSLYFEYTGTLYEMNNSQSTKAISGKVQIDSLKEISCSYSPRQIKAMINQTPFRQVALTGSSNSEESKWIAISDDGMMITFITARELRDMPPGTYTFTKDDRLDRIKIQKYIGPFKATDLKHLDNDEWENYQYEGELIIEGKEGIPDVRTNGKFNLRAFNDEGTVYEVTNGEFSL